MATTPISSGRRNARTLSGPSTGETCGRALRLLTCTAQEDAAMSCCENAGDRAYTECRTVAGEDRLVELSKGVAALITGGVWAPGDDGAPHPAMADWGAQQLFYDVPHALRFSEYICLYEAAVARSVCRGEALEYICGSILG